MLIQLNLLYTNRRADEQRSTKFKSIDYSNCKPDAPSSQDQKFFLDDTRDEFSGINIEAEVGVGIIACIIMLGGVGAFIMYKKISQPKATNQLDSITQGESNIQDSCQLLNDFHISQIKHQQQVQQLDMRTLEAKFAQQMSYNQMNAKTVLYNQKLRNQHEINTLQKNIAEMELRTVQENYNYQLALIGTNQTLDETSDASFD